MQVTIIEGENTDKALEMAYNIFRNAVLSGRVKLPNDCRIKLTDKERIIKSPVSAEGANTG
ncbi:hypothetical protein NZD89_28495 (plasmid) [Alicyclobacillus fastidiosus]|uniref:DUF2922 domain-containing protein n=1 Tax=Alicyclobacillus fastidiosus TaxID=392011 RepID=A0ABY6ZPP0_9BACL|nr:hypothetical protein [Alicyclobacillus fastidiosus]WAH44799.1 hypothetical protein NZD89_28495 [Alicyclobacillus fastidiosus]GMA65756.1 hypothetical protein GCM10025859_61960 [Alicyclobacillus fastidiosus]GMA65929.1 hypothetical protein GCM10025859_63700 [Alicyclobacillus fastidiosus]